ncbi:MAG TPA: serine hydrolase, partial [Variovorax sp.]|nr:serine hydrolase [Variovorax sp.]
IVSLLVGIAIGQGALPGTASPLLGFYPERTDLLTDAPPRRARITLAHLLGMSSGLHWDEGALPNDETRLFWTADLPAYVLGRPFDSEPGERFLYNSGGTALLADVLVRSQGKSLSALAREQLFEPMGIRDWVWATDMRGRELAFTGLRMRPRDLAKLGQLVLDGGRWQGRQLVPAAWIGEATSTHLQTPVRLPGASGRTFGYGYQWWTGSAPWQGRPMAWSAGFGNGGQRLYTVPDLGLVVAISAGGYGSHAINAAVHALFERIVTAAQPLPVRTLATPDATPPR